MLKRSPATDNKVYLTFDDGPDPEWTPRILDILAASNACATFFVIGQQAQACAALVRRIVSEGHVIGNHGWSHRHPWTLRTSAARREVRDGASAIADILGFRPILFRPPHGRLRPAMVDEARSSGQSVVLWTRSAVDWGPSGHATAIAKRLAKTIAGDIVLMHDSGRGINRPEQLVTVLPRQLRSMTAGDLSSVPLGETL